MTEKSTFRYFFESAIYRTLKQRAILLTLFVMQNGQHSLTGPDNIMETRVWMLNTDHKHLLNTTPNYFTAVVSGNGEGWMRVHARFRY